MFNCSTHQPPEKQQLLKGSLVLEDAKKLADLKVENDDVIALTFMQEGRCRMAIARLCCDRPCPVQMERLRPPKHSLEGGLCFDGLTRPNPCS